MAGNSVGEKTDNHSRRTFLLQGAAAGATLVTGKAMAYPAAEPDLIGAWRLVSHSTSEEDPGPWIGLMIFTRKYFGRALMMESRKELSFDFEKETKLTPQQEQELLKSFREFRAFSGTYEVRGGVLRFHSDVISNMAHRSGTIQRQVERSGNRLRLWGRTISGRAAEEVWEKIE